MAKFGDIETTNKTFYHSKEIATWIAKKQQLMPEEQSFLRNFWEEITGKSILEIGIGIGRTIPYLLQLSANYTGVDFSPGMLQEACARFPDERLEERDATECPPNLRVYPAKG
jgi:cyclopropane fatty-acyl-phospholipid synthase-like methyltransferase